MRAIYVLLLLAWLYVPLSGADTLSPPIATGDYVALGTGEYLHIEDHTSLDTQLQQRFAVEFWIYLESLPELPFQQRVILAKPGSYAVILRNYAELQRIQGFPLPVQMPRLHFLGLFENGGHTMGGAEIETGKWLHLSYETHLNGGWRVYKLYANKRLVGEGGSSNGGPWGSDSSSDLYIGDIPREVLTGHGYQDLAYDTYVSSPMCLDELRLGKGITEPPNLNDPAAIDGDTTALWHFDEGRYASTYSSVDGALTLRREGGMPVSARENTAVTWAALKRPTWRSSF